MSSLTWREAYALAMKETIAAFDTRGYDCPPPDPGREEFIGTFRSFYDEIILTHRITLWPVDPAGSHRMAESRAAVEWADNFPLTN